ncbi:MAG: hypothetical protein QXG86_02945 [Candidatus Woesearchaeota archaeon]
MKQINSLFLIIFILILSAFAVSFRWDHNFKEFLRKTLEEKTININDVTENIDKNLSTETHKTQKATLKLGERAAYRKEKGAQITINVEALSEGDAEIYAELLYQNKPVANNSILLSSISKGQKINVTINIPYTGLWTAFNISQK